MSSAYTLKDLLDIHGSSRTVRAYAFLNASLTVGENSSNPARDVLDCFLPFVAAGVGDQKGWQLDLSKLQTYLKTQFGFDIPIYALDQFCAPLAEQGHLIRDKHVGYICVGNSGDFLKQQTQALAGFDDLGARLAKFSSELRLPNPPHSPTWLDALIGFLRGLPDESSIRPVEVKGVLTGQGSQIEHYVVGRFIDECHKTNDALFSNILSVFKGILIEDFITGDFQASIDHKVRDLVVYYDTPILMRLLGCSGTLLSQATHELHRYLQDLGCSTQFLPVNESEVNNSINAMLGAKDYGPGIHGETGEAIERGEYSVAQLRMLNGSFVEKLATMNVFETKHTINNINNAQKFQIDERKFELTLKSEADKRKIGYGYQNIRHDAQVLGSVMVFRRGHAHRDVMKSRFIFVTSNKFLAVSSRRFLIQEDHLRQHECPPILHVSQLTTMMWLLKNRGFEDRLVTRDLLANCYAAYRPEPEWLSKFIEAVTAAQESGEKIAGDAIVLQAARRVAQDQSFGRTALLPKISLAEILSRAKEDTEALAREQNRLGREDGMVEARKAFLAEQQARANKLGEKIVSTIETICVSVSVLLAILVSLQSVMPWAITIPLSLLFLPISILSVLDLFGLRLVRNAFDALRTQAAHVIFKFLMGGRF
jgi:hypothetical protein